MILVETLQADLVLAEELLEWPETVLEFRVALAQDALLGLVELGHRTGQHPARRGFEERLHVGHRRDVVGALALRDSTAAWCNASATCAWDCAATTCVRAVAGPPWSPEVHATKRADDHTDDDPRDDHDLSFDAPQPRDAVVTREYPLTMYRLFGTSKIATSRRGRRFARSPPR